VFLGASPLLPLVAHQYARSGAEVAAVLDTSPLQGKIGAFPALLCGGSALAKGLCYLASLAARRIRVEYGVRPLAIESGGREAVTGLRFLDRRGRERHVACDAVAYGFGLRPETQLADLAGCSFDYDPRYRQWFPRADPDGRADGLGGIYLAGDGARIGGADAAEASGELAAHALAADLRAGTVAAGRLSALRRRVATLRRFQAEGLARAFTVPQGAAAALADEVPVCRCEAITAGEIRRTVGPGFGAGEINRAKAFSRIGMGRCQGRFCGFGGAEILAHALGVDQGAVGRLRGQAPVKPIPLGARLEAREGADGALGQEASR
jgi:hypothetical protein